MKHNVIKKILLILAKYFIYLSKIPCNIFIMKVQSDLEGFIDISYLKKKVHTYKI